jgi:hypothetical protein
MSLNYDIVPMQIIYDFKEKIKGITEYILTSKGKGKKLIYARKKS